MSELYYTYYQSPIGLIKIGSTEHYIAELGFIDKPEQMKHGEPGISEVMHQCTEQLIEFFSGKRKNFDIPVYQPGTFFQQKVWGELLQIPYGKTISYLELSRFIGDEKAVRAVAAEPGHQRCSRRHHALGGAQSVAHR